MVKIISYREMCKILGGLPQSKNNKQLVDAYFEFLWGASPECKWQRHLCAIRELRSLFSIYWANTKNPLLYPPGSYGELNLKVNFKKKKKKWIDKKTI